MKKMMSVLFSLLIIAVLFSGCYFSIGLFPRLGETTWEYRVYLGTTTYASGTFVIDKRINFEDLSGTVKQVHPVATDLTYAGNIDKAGNVTINRISLSATEAIKFSGLLNNAENLITGNQEHTADQTATPITWEQADWVATKTSK